MARPKKERVVCSLPKYRLFDVPDAPDAPTVTLEADEYEAVRLHDLERLSQAEVAAQMRISRPSAALLLMSAHKKIADALVNGKRIRIEESGCCICKIGKKCPLEKGSTCPKKHRCGAACKDRYKDCD